ILIMIKYVFLLRIKKCISFKNKEINNCLKEYAVDYKKDNILIEKTETNYESTLTRLMLINDKLR
ncbi:hypothetical protein DW057_14795, partial [Lachnospira eligens]